MVDKNVVRRGYDGLAETYADERDPEDREGKLLERLLADLSRPARILDVGCGQGTQCCAAWTANPTSRRSGSISRASNCGSRAMPHPRFRSLEAI